MYTIIGFGIGSIFISISSLIFGLIVLAGIKGYVADEKSDAKAAISMASKFSALSLGTKCDNIGDAMYIAGIALGIGCLCVVFWPVVVFGLFGYGMLRTVRFAHRIKKSITGLVSKKKCLKDYNDDDAPKTEF